MRFSITRNWKKWGLTIMLILVDAPAIYFAIYLAIYSSIFKFVVVALFSAIIPFTLISLLIQGYFNGYIEICEEGISFKTNRIHNIKWVDIKYVVATNQSNGKYIGFFGSDFKEEFQTSKNYYEYINIPIKMFSENFVYIDYRTEVLDEIKKYWGNQIINEDDLYSKRK